MLLNLNIKNAALIEQLTLNIDNGMTVITGETGAGKSIIIGSVNMILGARANKDFVRFGADKAILQAVFSADNKSDFADYGINIEDNIIITREIFNDGKSISRVNGIIMPQSIVREITQNLVNIHGQHDSQALLTSSKHIHFLDKYAKNDSLLLKYNEIYEKKINCEKKLASLEIDEAERIRKIDLLSYQVDEIEKAQLRIGEKKELQEQRILIQNGEKISNSLNGAYELLYNTENSAYDNISNALNLISKISSLDEKFEEFEGKITELQYSLEDISHEIYNISSENEYNEKLLNDIEERLDTINKLERKYGNDEETVLEFYNNAKKELEEITDSDAEKIKIKKELQDITDELHKLAKGLSISRKKASKTLSEEIEKELYELDMPNVKFIVSVTEENEFNKNGIDIVEFLISPNLGEPEKPLDKIASGGELSRIILAIKMILADSDDVDTLIFDEIDTGVSGSAAKKIAEKLSLLSNKKQIICVTHHPQIAAAGDNHYSIKKTEIDGRTVTNAELLEGDLRVAEIARITDGDNITKTSIDHAKEMIMHYRKVKSQDARSGHCN